jgi:beta-galactosidase
VKKIITVTVVLVWSLALSRSLATQIQSQQKPGGLASTTQPSAHELDGFHRVAYDNLGVTGKQPHLRQGSAYAYPLEDIPAKQVAAHDPARTVAFDNAHVVLVYEGLPLDAQYKLALTLLSDGARVETISCGDTVIREKLVLEKGQRKRLLFDIPNEAYAEGRLTLSVKRDEGPNAVVSEASLYSTAQALEPVLSMSAYGTLDQQVLGIIRDLNSGTPMLGVRVKICARESNGQLHTVTDQAGAFGFTIPPTWQGGGGLHVQATCDATVLEQDIAAIELFPPRLMPRPATTDAVKTPILMLNGTWKFSPAPPARFPAQADMLDQFVDINVPGEWVMQGFDVPKGQAAAYYREFPVPGDFAGKRIILHCDAVYAQAEVWVNGRQVGAHAGGMTAFQLDITNRVKPGQMNRLALKVTNETQVDVLASGTQYAVHPLGGITRKLYVFAVPLCAVTEFDLSTVFDAQYRDAEIQVRLGVENSAAHISESMQARFSLRDQAGKAHTLANSQIELARLLPGQSRLWKIKLPMKAPKKWDAEHPNLYTLECELRAGGKAGQTVRRRFGFRQIEVRGDELFVNNRPIKLHGVNRHEVHPLRGRSLTAAQWRRDAELFRQANVNYIRSSHYPPAEEFLDACDELGLFVECEAPLCWVQHGANANWGQPGWDYLDKKLYEPLLRANLENVAFNRNHPSIIIWSLANESRWSPQWARVLQAVEQVDPTRPTAFHDQCYGGYNNAGSTAQIANMHYPGPGGPQQAATQERPLLFGEYCHLNTYNRHELVTDPGLREAWGRGFKRMWDKIYTTPGCLGGALWSGIDDSFHLPSGVSVGYGAWGPIDGWRRAKPEYFHVKKVYSPVRIDAARAFVLQQDGTLDVAIENRHDFSNLLELTILWRIGNKNGIAQADIPARQRGSLRIGTGLTELSDKTLELQFLSQQGFVVDEYRLAIGSPGQDSAVDAFEPKQQLPQVATHDNVWVIRAGDVSYKIDKGSGQIVAGQARDSLLLTEGPELMILPLNRAGGTQMTEEVQGFAPFTDSCTERTVSAVTIERDEDQVIIDVRDQYTQARGGYRLRIDGQGKLDIEYRYELLEAINPRQWGMVVTVSRQCDTLAWQRKGLWTQYPSAHIGRLQGRARAFAGTESCGPLGPRRRPDHAWALDNSVWGTNDFRSTKENIYMAQLLNHADRGVTVLAHGHQHVRAWVADSEIFCLIADYSNAGAEGFFRSHAAVEDRPLKEGDRINGEIRLMPK